MDLNENWWFEKTKKCQKTKGNVMFEFPVKFANIDILSKNLLFLQWKTMGKVNKIRKNHQESRIFKFKELVLEEKIIFFKNFFFTRITHGDGPALA